MQGRSRSATLVIAYLLWRNDECSYAKPGSKYKLYETLDAVQKIRKIVQPNMGFMGQLVKWEDSFKSDEGKIKRKEEKDYIKNFKVLHGKEALAIREILSVTSLILNPTPSDELDYEY